MRLCFIDFAPWDYNVVTPAHRPLGGSQSAMCYLAMELARLGHDITVVTATTNPGRFEGVECLRLQDTEYGLRGFDSVIVLNAPGNVELRKYLPPSTRFVLWTHHAINQPAMQRLRRVDIRKAWDAVVCGSEWQRRGTVDELGVDEERTIVLRNGIAPAFEGLFSSREDFLAAKNGDVLRLAYTSTPFRGLVMMPGIFAPFRAANPDAVLEVYSGMAVYMTDADKDRAQFGKLYDTLAGMDGVEMVGSVSQPELAKRLRGAHILAYPNAFPENCSIAVMEAMAAGMRVISSELGGLPETTDGFARLLPIDIEIDDAATRIDIKNTAEYSAAFLREMSKPYTTAGLYQQVEHMNKHHTWAVRARDWVEFLGA